MKAAPMQAPPLKDTSERPSVGEVCGVHVWCVGLEAVASWEHNGPPTWDSVVVHPPHLDSVVPPHHHPPTRTYAGTQS